MAVIVITGASGFLGRHVWAHLSSCGHEVIPVTRRPIRQMTQVQDYSESPDADILIHLAEEPDRGKVNLLGEKYVSSSSRVIKSLSERFGKNIIYASSGTVYGAQSEDSFQVDAPTYATDTYSTSKLLNERIVLEPGGSVIRFSNIFGPGMSPNNVMSDIISQLSVGGALYVRNDAVCRDFLCISEAARLFGLLIDSDFRGILNLGSGVGTSIRELAELVLRIAGQENRQIIATEPSSQWSKNVLDISETKRILGWTPIFGLEHHLREFIAGLT